MSALIKAPVAFTFNCSTGSTGAVAANAKRNYLLIINDSDTVVYLAFGEAAVANKGVRLNANGGSYEMSERFGNLHQGAVNCINASGTKVLCGVEG